MNGLTLEAVQELTRQGKTNQIKKKRGNGTVWIIISNVFTYFNAIFCLLAVLLIMTGSFRNLTFLPAVIANVLIGIVQQIRSKRVLDKLALLDVSEYTAIRDGKEVSVASDQLVLGDVIILESGQQIPADAVVLSGEAGANEALLTGEADEVEKTAGSELKSGSFLISGMVTAKLIRVGADSYAARLTEKAKEVKEARSEMIRDIKRIVKWAGIVIIPIGLALVGQSIFALDITPEFMMTLMGYAAGQIIGPGNWGPFSEFIGYCFQLSYLNALAGFAEMAYGSGFLAAHIDSAYYLGSYLCKESSVYNSLPQ